MNVAKKNLDHLLKSLPALRNPTISALSLEGWVAGSPHYLAPEQLRGEAVDPRTDVYALGVVFYELLAGRKAFTGDSVEQITTAVLANHPAPANELRSGINKYFQDIPPGRRSASPVFSAQGMAPPTW